MKIQIHFFFRRPFFYLFIAGLTLGSHSIGQYSQLQNKAKRDSIPAYPYTFPILGKKAAEKGFDIPYPAGIMINTFTGKSDILISNLQLGYSNDGTDIPLTPVDFIKFDKATAKVSNVNVRPDLWVFPFLDVYGIFGYTQGETSVSIVEPVVFNTKAKLKGSTYGFGTTLAGGLGKLFVVADFNWTWSDLDILDKPANTNIISFRLGKAFLFKTNPKSNIAVWAGVMKMNIGGATQGKVSFADIIPQHVWDQKDKFVQDYYEWYNSLGNSPSDIAKKQAADKVLTPMIERIDARDGSGTVSYYLDKRPSHKWNMIIGGQYQLNKSWQFRTEWGFFGGRTQALVSANYRFGI